MKLYNWYLWLRAIVHTIRHIPKIVKEVHFILQLSRDCAMRMSSVEDRIFQSFLENKP